MYTNCQVCGNPIFSPYEYGTEPDGSFNQDFCSNCYKEGHIFTRDYDSYLDGPPTPPWDMPYVGRGVFNNGFGNL